jgi:hypothetical protein
MGGRGSGGRRTGSGRKGKRAVVLQLATAPNATAAPVAIAGTFDPPAELQGTPAQLAKLVADLAFLEDAAGSGDPNPQIAELQARVDELTARAFALAIWQELAPYAFAKQTLTHGTSAAFVMLCRAVVAERALSASPATASGPNHRGVMQRVDKWMHDFQIAPFGKPMDDAKPSAPAASKWKGLLA